MSAPGVSSTITADPTPFYRALNDVERATKATFNQVGRSVSSLTGPIQAVMGGFGSLTSLLGGGALVLAGRRAIQLGDDLDKAATKAGITGEAMSSLSYAAKLADVDLSSLSTALRFMQVNLSEAGTGAKKPLEALQALGLTIQELRDLAPDKQFELIADRISQLTDPAERARAATELFGRAGSALLPLFEEGARGIREAREEAQRLGLVLREDQIKSLAETDDKIKRMTASWDAFAAKLTGTVAPAIQAVLDLMSFNTGSPADFQSKRSTADLEAFLGRLEANPGQLTGGEAKTLEYVRQELARRRQALGGAVQSVFASGASAGGGGGAAPGYAPPEEKPAKVAREREIADVSVSYTVRVGNENSAAVKKKRAEEHKAWEESRALQQDSLDFSREIAQAQLDTEEQKLQRLADMGQISRDRELAGYMDIEQRRYQIDRAALAARAADIEAEPLARQQANQQLELLEIDHLQRMASLRDQQRASIAQPWQQLFGSMQAGFQGVLTTFARGYATIGATLRGLLASVLNAFTDMIAKIAAQWLTMKIMQLLFSKATIVGKAAEAGAGGVASMAGAPFPLNLSAPAFGAAMAALAATYLAIPAAEQGWDIPAGINPVTQLHQREMVLPQSIADVVRGMASPGAGAPEFGAPPLQLKATRAAPGQLLIRERDLMAALSRLGIRNFRPT